MKSESGLPNHLRTTSIDDYVHNEQLRSRRAAIGVTQQQFSELCGFGVRRYEKIERMETVPSLRTAHIIARELGATVDELFPRELYGVPYQKED